MDQPGKVANPTRSQLNRENKNSCILRQSAYSPYRLNLAHIKTVVNTVGGLLASRRVFAG